MRKILILLIVAAAILAALGLMAQAAINRSNATIARVDRATAGHLPAVK